MSLRVREKLNRVQKRLIDKQAITLEQKFMERSQKIKKMKMKNEELNKKLQSSLQRLKKEPLTSPKAQKIPDLDLNHSHIYQKYRKIIDSQSFDPKLNPKSPSHPKSPQTPASILAPKVLSPSSKKWRPPRISRIQLSHRAMGKENKLLSGSIEEARNRLGDQEKRAGHIRRKDCSVLTESKSQRVESSHHSVPPGSSRSCLKSDKLEVEELDSGDESGMTNPSQYLKGIMKTATDISTLQGSPSQDKLFTHTSQSTLMKINHNLNLSRSRNSGDSSEEEYGSKELDEVYRSYLRNAYKFLRTHKKVKFQNKPEIIYIQGETGVCKKESIGNPPLAGELPSISDLEAEMKRRDDLDSTMSELNSKYKMNINKLKMCKKDMLIEREIGACRITKIQQEDEKVETAEVEDDIRKLVNENEALVTEIQGLVRKEQLVECGGGAALQEGGDPLESVASGGVYDSQVSTDLRIFAASPRGKPLGGTHVDSFEAKWGRLELEESRGSPQQESFGGTLQTSSISQNLHSQLFSDTKRRYSEGGLLPIDEEFVRLDDSVPEVRASREWLKEIEKLESFQSKLKDENTEINKQLYHYLENRQRLSQEVDSIPEPSADEIKWIEKLIEKERLTVPKVEGKGINRNMVIETSFKDINNSFYHEYEEIFSNRANTQRTLVLPQTLYASDRSHLQNKSQTLKSALRKGFRTPQMKKNKRVKFAEHVIKSETTMDNLLRSKKRKVKTAKHLDKMFEKYIVELQHNKIKCEEELSAEEEDGRKCEEIASSSAYLYDYNKYKNDYLKQEELRRLGFAKDQYFSPKSLKSPGSEGSGNETPNFRKHFSPRRVLAGHSCSVDNSSYSNNSLLPEFAI